jgi:hypothetical protein
MFVGAGDPVDPTPATLGLETMAACCKLEGGLYSSNVVLGRLFDVCTPEVDAMVEQLLGYAADMATNHTSKQGHDIAWCAQQVSSDLVRLLLTRCLLAANSQFNLLVNFLLPLWAHALHNKYSLVRIWRAHG